MSASAQFFSPAGAAQRLGVSIKALRVYEQRGLIVPGRTAAGWRAYGPEEMARAGEIVALRALGLSLAQVARVLAGDSAGLEPAMAAHQGVLEARRRELSGTIDRVRQLRAELAGGKSPSVRELTGLLTGAATTAVAFELPWPWGGELFELNDVRAINYLVGPLGSGKTRLARRLAETLPGAIFLPMERVQHGGPAAQAQLDADDALRAKVDQTLAWLVEDGAAASEALTTLLVGLETPGAAIVVVDMVEQGLDHGTQEALIAFLRRRGPGACPLFLMTRSSAVLDLAAIGPDETIILCPANHAPPSQVAPYPGAPGYEAVATCLAIPEVRARSEGVIAWRPQVA